MKLKQIFRYGFLLVLLVGGFLVVQNRQAVQDWLYLRSYTPSPVIAQLATDSGMSSHGRDLFYVSDPKLNNKTEFNENCIFPERSLVLGCYDGQYIYILDIEEEELEGVEEVTAAHEMLHAAYARLSGSEKAQIDTWLNDLYVNLDNQRIVDLVEEYRAQDPTVVSNELHSILPTEYRDLPQELEQYYKKYFDDRLKVIAAAEAYESVFIEIDNQIEKYDKQLANLQVEITDIENELAGQKSNIDSQRQILDNLFNANQFQSYNQKVPTFNALVNSYNANVNELQSLVKRYNNIVNKRNAIAVNQNSLIQSLDSSYQEL